MPTAKKAASTLLQTTRASTTRKKTAPKKKATKRVVTKTSRRSSDSVPIKNNVGKVTATKKSVRTPQAPSPKKHVKTKSLLPALPPQISLSVLLPYRFPIDINKLAVGTARFGGVFFVVIGALFTLLFANSVLSPHSQMAATINTSLEEKTNSGTNVNTTLTTQPHAEFIINNPSELKGTVQLRIKVPQASRITVLAFFKTQERHVTFGSPAKVSEDTWEMNIDTRQFDDGEYKLRALIVNPYGTYESADDAYIHIVNSVQKEKSIDDSSPTTTNQNGVTSDTDMSAQQDTAQQSVVLSVDKKESASELRFEVSTAKAQKVKIFAQDKTNTAKLIGYAYASNGTTWKYRWNLTGVPGGAYLVYAEVDGVRSNLVSVKVLTTISTQAQTPQTLSATSTAVSEKPLAPEIKIGVDTNTPLSNVVTAKIEVENARSIEVFALPKNSLVQKYLGVARKVDDTVWLYAWDTQTAPNGEYTLFVYVQNAFGTYTKESPLYAVQNSVTRNYTEEERRTIEKLTAVAKEEPTSTYVNEATAASVAAIASSALKEASTTRATEVTVPLDAYALTQGYQEQLEQEMQRLASALRVKDENAVFEIKERLNKLKRDIMKAHIGALAESELVTIVDEYIAKTIKRVEDDVVRIEKVITERTQLQAEADTDKDGISDYDEVAFYATDPYSADTDGDSFPDGAEILKGYDPLNAASEVLVVYESPKENGIVREDILAVASVVTAATPDEKTVGAPAAIISGRGLPNSFVTLYIFSTPIVITVKTDREGNWNYRFDKELEDGKHEVYVGVTDNAGKLVAKSAPFTFIKEAQAFTGTAHAAQETQPEEKDSFASQYALYLVLSISVVAIGLVLILLGLYLDPRSRKLTVLQEGEPETI